jgi:hypothetical protein
METDKGIELIKFLLWHYSSIYLVLLCIEVS